MHKRIQKWRMLTRHFPKKILKLLEMHLKLVSAIFDQIFILNQIMGLQIL